MITNIVFALVILLLFILGYRVNVRLNKEIQILKKLVENAHENFDRLNSRLTTIAGIQESIQARIDAQSVRLTAAFEKIDEAEVIAEHRFKNLQKRLQKTDITNQDKFKEIDSKLLTVTSEQSTISAKVEKQSEKFTAALERVDKNEAAIIKEISSVYQILEKFKKDLAHLTGIDSDSKQLTEAEDVEKSEELIKALKQEVDDKGIHGVSASTILDHEQSAAFELMETTNRNLFITGKAGTGKSFLLKAFVKTTKKKTLVLAPTGIAALNVEGATLHSTMGFENLVRIDIDDLNESTFRLKSEKRLVLREVDTLIIDEVSMVRADILDKVSKILQIVNRSELPFGGKQIILFGDLFQLPPITKDKERIYLMERYGGIFFFQSDAYIDANFKFIELTINHRQKDDQEFFNILNRIREGNFSRSDIDTLNKRQLKNRPNGKEELGRVVTLFPQKSQAEELNNRELAKINAKEYCYKARVTLNTKKVAPALEAVFPISSELKLKVGALIMMVANDPEKRWVNGTMGIVKSLRDDGMTIVINGQPYDIGTFLFEEKEAVYDTVNKRIEYQDVMVVEQFPVVLAYAITIHKSQGMTYHQIACDVSRCFAAGQAYVALSRCSSLDGLYMLSELNASSMRIDPDVQQFYLSQHQ